MKRPIGVVVSLLFVVALAACGSSQPAKAPSLSLAWPSGVTTDTASVTVSGSLQLDPSAKLSTLVFTLNGGSAQNCKVTSTTFACAVGGLALGANTMVITAKDSNGAKASVKVSITYVLPTLSVAISSPPDGATVTSQAVPVSGSVSGLADGTTLVSVAYTLNGGSEQPCSVSASDFTCSVSGLRTASNGVVVTATASDSATGTASLGVSFSPVAPLVTISSPSNGDTVTSHPLKVLGSVTVASGATLAAVDYTLNGGSTKACSVSGSTFTCTVGKPANGANTFVVTATDSNGVTGSASVQVTYGP